MNDAGKVAFTPKGDYSSTVTYEYLDTVVYNGNAYVALKTTTGNAPTDEDTDENWKLLARGGPSVPVATKDTAGVVKLSDSSAVTDSTGLALPATEKNASVEGTLANQISVLNTNLTQCPTKIHKDYSVDNQAFEYKVNKLSLIFITYGNVQSADFYVCRCISATAYALVPIYKTGNLDNKYDINLDIESKIITITSKVSWIQVDVISL